MPLENGRQGKDKQNPEKLRPLIDEGESADMVAANDPAEATPEKAPEASGAPATPQEAATAIKEETKPSPRSPEEPAQADKSYYAEASLTKKITVFTLTTVLILIALGVIYAYWPLGTPR